MSTKNKPRGAKPACKPPQLQSDFAILGGGSVYLFFPLTQAAQAWLDEHCPADADHQYSGKALAVEHRYIEDIINYAIRDGLTPPAALRQEAA